METNTRTPNNIYILDEIKEERCCLGKEYESLFWHRRICHIHFDNIININKKQVVREMPKITKPINTISKHCQHEKETNVEFKTKEYSLKKTLEIVHIDLCGAMRTKGLNGEQYFMLLIDDYTRMVVVFFLKKNSKEFEHFKIYKRWLKTRLI